MRDIYLYHDLAEEFGSHFRWDVNSVAECVSAFEANFPGKFFQHIRNGRYQIIRGDVALDDPDQISRMGLTMLLGDDTKSLHIIPVLEGGKGGRGKAIMQIVFGIALISVGGLGAAGMLGGPGSFGATIPGGTFFANTALEFSITWGQLAFSGFTMALQGIAGMLTPVPEIGNQSVTNRESPDERASYLFTGAVNTTEQGGPVPLVYGEFRVGSQVISGGIVTEQLEGSEDPADEADTAQGVPSLVPVITKSTKQFIRGQESDDDLWLYRVKWNKPVGYDITTIQFRTGTVGTGTLEFSFNSSKELHDSDDSFKIEQIDKPELTTLYASFTNAAGRGPDIEVTLTVED